MKTNSISRKWYSVCGTFAVILTLSSAHAAKYVAHEWGTFTSVQGADGAPLEWRPLDSSHLPSFVYDWRKPGCSRIGVGGVGPKSGMITLQRMETPVIYFYSDKGMSVDVQVDFPKGVITEWFPQAAQIGPSVIAPVPAAVVKLDNAAHHVGAKPNFTFETLINNHALQQSRAHWADVEILPPKESAATANLVLSDKSGSHYFAARDTDANYVRLDSLSTTNPGPQYEKFIFYRGVGNFSTPLRVTQDAKGDISVANMGEEQLKHLFLLTLRHGKGAFVPLKDLPAGAEQKFEAKQDDVPLETLTSEIGAQMQKALVEAGLYQREAAAMVKTWQDSWFAEDGVRVLYLLPRAWTDQTLPLLLNPKPGEIVRVMVGRAELITSNQRQELTDFLIKTKAGDSQAREQLRAELKKLGRFAEPALRLATKDLSREVSDNGWTLLAEARL